MTDQWLPPGPRSPLPPIGHPGHGPYAAPPPYAAPNPYAAFVAPGSPYGQRPPHRRRTGLVVLVVAIGSVLFLGLAAALVAVAVNVYGSDGSAASSPVRLSGPSGTEFPIVLPEGFRIGGDSDLKAGHLAAQKGTVFPSYIEVYVDSRSQSEAKDLAAVAAAVRQDDADHDAVNGPVYTDSIKGLRVVKWAEDFAGSS